VETKAVTSAKRIGWLLRVNRLHGQRTRYRRLSAFVHDLSVAADRRIVVSTVSRWETGACVPPYWAVRLYERLLGLRTGSLVVTCDTVVRYFAAPGPRVPQWVRRRSPLPGVHLDELVDLACGEGVVSSLEWDRLTELLAAQPQLVLSPRDTWARLAERLLTEMSIADGVNWMHRAESFHRLIAHPAGSEAAIAVAEAAAADRSRQSMIGTVGVFNASAHPAANAAVLRHVLDPVTDRTFYGGLLTSAKKLRYGDFEPRQLRDLLPVLVEFASGGGHYAVLAARLVQLLPAGLRHRLPDRVWRLVSEMLRPFSTVTARRLSDEVHLDSELADSAPDDVLPGLVHEMLYDPVFDVRLCTMFLVYATPYRRPLAGALANELLRRVSRGPLEQVRTVLDSLRVLGGAPERRLIERLLIAGQAPAPVLDAASYALGHVGGTSSDAFWSAAIARYTDRWVRPHDPHTLSTLDRLVYGIGITDRQSLLRAATQDPHLPATVRTAASWWADLPPYLRDSVQRHGPADR
jgi:hypothetical protein